MAIRNPETDPLKRGIVTPLMLSNIQFFTSCDHSLPSQVFVLEGILGLLNAQRDLTGGLGGEVANIESDLGQFAGLSLISRIIASWRKIQTLNLQESPSSSANWSRLTRA